MTQQISIGIVDYGMGNCRSVANALQSLNAPELPVTLRTVIGSDRQLLKSVDALILPGVGAFDAAMWNLARQRLDDPIREWVAADKPLLGICLGMQLLATASEEGSSCNGLGVIDARVIALQPANGLCVPHVGWNEVESLANIDEQGLFAGVPMGSHYYFDHSYHLICPPAIACATVNYGERYVAAIATGSLFATQFHPEKSQRHGLRLLSNFIRHVSQAKLPAAWRRTAPAIRAFG